MSKFEKGKLTATIMPIYQKNGPNLPMMYFCISDIDALDDIVEGNLHIHIGGDNCAEVFVTEGNAERVSNFIGRMRAIRGIEQVKYSVVPLQ